LCDNCRECEKACPSGALADGTYKVDPCFMYWSYGFKKLPPSKISEWPAFIRMLLEHYKRRDILIESGQTYITDVDNCLECMRTCPCGEQWKVIRPAVLPFQKSSGTGPLSLDKKL
jgi:ferredoxin